MICERRMDDPTKMAAVAAGGVATVMGRGVNAQSGQIADDPATTATVNATVAVAVTVAMAVAVAMTVAMTVAVASASAMIMVPAADTTGGQAPDG